MSEIQDTEQRNEPIRNILEFRIFFAPTYIKLNYLTNAAIMPSIFPSCFSKVSDLYSFLNHFSSRISKIMVRCQKLIYAELRKCRIKVLIINKCWEFNA